MNQFTNHQTSGDDCRESGEGETIIDFRNEMASTIVSRYKLNPEAKPVVAKWPDWEYLWRGGYRCSTSGEAFHEWLNCI